MSETFTLSQNKGSWEKWFIDIDISSWLSTETISAVAFVAKDENGTTVTETLLDAVKCTYSGSTIRPYVQGGTDGITYFIICHVTTAEGSYGEFIVRLTVQDV